MTPAETVWQQLRTEAAALSAKEPLLAEVVRRLAPEDGSLAVAVARRLVDLLDEPGIGHPALVTLFTTVMAADPRIALAAARDLQAVRGRDPACASTLHAVLNFKGFHTLQAHRIAHALWQGGRGELACWLSNRASLVLGPDIHPAARLGVAIMPDHGSGIVIGETAVVEDDVSILQNVTLGGTGKDLGARHPVIRRRRNVRPSGAYQPLLPPHCGMARKLTLRISLEARGLWRDRLLAACQDMPDRRRP